MKVNSFSSGGFQEFFLALHASSNRMKRCILLILLCAINCSITKAQVPIIRPVADGVGTPSVSSSGVSSSSVISIVGTNLNTTNLVVYLNAAATNPITLLGSSGDGVYYFLRNTNWAAIGSTPGPLYTNSTKFLWKDTAGDDGGDPNDFYYFTDITDFGTTGNSYFSGQVGGTWRVGPLNGVKPVSSYYGAPPIVAANGPFTGDGAGLTNIIGFIANNNGNGTNTTFRPGPTNSVVVLGTNDSGNTSIWFKNPDADTNVFVIHFGRATTVRAGEIIWFAVHGSTDGSEGGELALSAPGIALAMAADTVPAAQGTSFVPYYGPARNLQIGIGTDSHGYAMMWPDSSGNRTSATNAYSLPFLFNVTSSNNTSVKPGWQGYAYDATGGSGHAGLRGYYTFDTGLMPQTGGILSSNWAFVNSPPFMDALYGGGANSAGLVTFYGQVLNTNYIGDISNTTNQWRVQNFSGSCGTNQATAASYFHVNLFSRSSPWPIVSAADTNTCFQQFPYHAGAYITNLTVGVNGQLSGGSGTNISYTLLTNVQARGGTALPGLVAAANAATLLGGNTYTNLTAKADYLSVGEGGILEIKPSAIPMLVTNFWWNFDIMFQDH